MWVFSLPPASQTLKHLDILLVMQIITPFVVRDNIADVTKALEETENLLKWFSNNEMKRNTDKWHLLLNSQELNTLKIDDLHISEKRSE